MTHPTPHLFITLCMTSLLAACGGEEPTAADYDDVAAGVTALVAGDSGGESQAMQDALEIAQGASALTLSASGTYQGTYAGVDYTYAVVCKNRQGAVLEVCDATTDSADVTVTWSGQLSLPRYTASVNRTGHWTLTDVVGPTPHLSGSGSFDVVGDFQALSRDATRSLDLNYDASYDVVTWDWSQSRITAGTITYSIVATRTASNSVRDASSELDMEAVITFASDGTAEVVLDGERRYALDLASGDLALEP